MAGWLADSLAYLATAMALSGRAALGITATASSTPTSKPPATALSEPGAPGTVRPVAWFEKPLVPAPVTGTF